MRVHSDSIVASLPPESVTRPIAIANTSQERTGGLVVRTVPAFVLLNKEYLFVDEWEWKLAFFFATALPRGSSAERFDKFDPTDGSLYYRRSPQSYIAAALITTASKYSLLKNPLLSRQVTYAEATQAVQRLIQVSPKTAPSP